MHYFRSYGQLPILLRGPANPAFNIGIAEAIKLSAAQHDEYAKVQNADVDNLNLLMELALEKLPFLAFAKSLENWRWDIYDSKITVCTKTSGNLEIILSKILPETKI